MLSPVGAVTVLFCEPPHRATKTFHGDTCQAYDAGAWFSASSLSLTGIDRMHEIISALRRCPEAIIIRGAIKEGAPQRILRRYKEKQGYSPWIEPASCTWVCLDFDQTDADMSAGAESAVRQVLTGLPEGLREASCVWQLSASAHKYSTFRGHLWFCLDRGYADPEVKRALKGHGVDASLFSPVQPHYVADPIFIDQADPITERCGLLRGASDVAVIRGAGTQRLRDMAEDLCDKAVRNIAACIRQKKPRHEVVNREAYKLGALCPHLLNEGDVFHKLFAAATEGEGALPPDRAQDEIRRALEDGKSKPELVGADWKGLMAYGKGYQPMNSAANVQIILEHDPRWSDCLAFNVRTEQEWYQREPPLQEVSGLVRMGRSVQDYDATAIGTWLQREYEMGVPRSVIDEVIAKVSHEASFDPVEEYLESLEWDSVDRMGDVPGALFGDTSQVAREAFGCWMISAVRRVYEPGCQSDHTIVLEGPQGIRKSSFWEWISAGHYGMLKSDITSKDSVIAVHGSWIVDMSELGSMRRSDVAAVKDFLTTRVDKIRLPYGRREVIMPRRCAICATHNPDGDEGYLRDTTGNRRIWPIVVSKMITGLTEPLRDQLWAEARAKYLAGVTSWDLSDQALAELAERHQGRLEDPPSSDPWVPVILEYLGRAEYPTVASVLTVGVGVGVDKVSHKERKRVERILREMGWTKGAPRYPKHPPVWVPPTGWVRPAGVGVLVPLVRPASSG